MAMKIEAGAHAGMAAKITCVSWPQWRGWRKWRINSAAKYSNVNVSMSIERG